MKFVDAHLHLSDSEYNGKIEEIVVDARHSNVVALVSNAMDLQTSLRNLELSERYSGLVYAAVGIHPWNVKHVTPEELGETVELVLQHKKYGGRIVAVGEIGLDFTYVKDEKSQGLQLKVFHEMLLAAEKSLLPTIIHSRGTAVEIMDILTSYNLKKVLFHWFSRPLSMLTQIVDRGYFITEGPRLVYSNRLQEIVRRIPLTNLLTETDGPVRFGGPFKGRMTKPSFVLKVVDVVARVKKMGKMEVASQIIENFARFFNVVILA